MALGLIGFLLSGPLFGQDEEETTSNPVSAEKLNENNEEEWEDVIFIPFKNLKQALQDQSQVIVPYLEYLKLKALEQQSTKTTALLQKAEYATRIEEDTARVSATLQFQVWGEKEVTFPLSTGNAALGEVSSEQGDIYLQSPMAGTTELVFPAAGNYTVKLEMMVQVQKGTEGKSFVLNIPSSSVTQFDLTINEERQKIDVQPNAVPVGTTSQAGETRFRSHLKPTNQITVSWHPEAGSRPEMNLLTSVDQKQEITIEGEVVLTKAELMYEILRGEMDQLQIAIPLSHQLLDIEAPGTNLKDWSIRKEENRQVIDVSFLSPLESKLTLVLQTERPLDEGNLQLLGASPDGESFSIQAIGAVRERGEVIVKAAGSLDLTVTKQDGVSRFRQNVSENDLGFRFFRPDATLVVSVKQIQPRVLATLTHQSKIQEESVETRVYAQFQIEREGLFEIEFNVPEGLNVQYVNGNGVTEHRFDEDARVLHVFFSQKTKGQVVLDIGTTQFFEEVAPDVDYFLSLIEALNVEKEEGTVSLYSSPSIDIQVLENDLFGLLPNTFIENKMIPQTPNLPLSHSWRYKERPVEVYFFVKPKPALVTATTSSLIDVQDELIRVQSEINYSIQHAGVESFLVAVPESVSEKVRITPATESSQHFQQAVPHGEPVDGWQTWLITAQQPVLGNFKLNLSYDQPLPGEGPTAEGGLRKYVYEPVRLTQVTVPEDLEKDNPLPGSIRGEVQVKSARHLSVKGEASGGNVENIDVREVNLKQYPDATLAYQFFAEPVSLDLEIRKYEIQEVLQTVINKAGIEIVLATDATATYLCNYRVRSSERQRFAIELPQGARPVRVLVNGDDATLEKSDAEAKEGHDSYYLNVSRMTASDADFYVSIQFIWEMTEVPFSTAGGKLLLPLPMFDDQGSGALVQQTRVGIWVPREYSLLGEPDRFTRSRSIPFTFTFFNVRTPFSQKMSTWMGLPENQEIELPQTGNGFYYNSLEQVNRIELTWWQNSFYSWIISITVAIIGFVLLRTSWNNRITILLCAVLLMALCLLNYGDWVMFTLFAGRFGLLFLAMLWLFKTWQFYQTSTTEQIVPLDPVVATSSASGETAEVSPPVEEQPDRTDPDKPQGS
ncbi:hypothetical protein [Polystyrenella longa]|uniref:hypothetical protein n=1 Tax=Polystyrenella longa TaxID=2528007 RepID=UPI00119CF23D|nr:hypothetical protein [Polystyrenella longa]